MRTRIADLERRVQLVEQSGLATRSRTETLRALLRLARAAKGLIDNQQTHRPRCHDCAACDIRDAADAFDWSDE